MCDLRRIPFALLILFPLACSPVEQRPQPAEPTLWNVVRLLKEKQFVDLTHAFDSDIPHWPGFPSERRETLYYYDPGVGSRGSGFFAQPGNAESFRFRASRMRLEMTTSFSGPVPRNHSPLV